MTTDGRPRGRIEGLLQEVVQRGGSDLVLVVGNPPVALVHGRAVRLAGASLRPSDIEELLAGILSPERRKLLHENREIDLALATPAGRFRINAFYQRGGPALVARSVQARIPTIGDLGLPVELVTLASTKHGLIFVTGPTGSGKSTTLAAMIDHCNQHVGGHIVTIEDPIEFVHPHKSAVVTQREVGTDVPTYGDAIRSLLRQAPTIVLVGETRDEETARALLRVAETGHLALSTLHAANVLQSLERFVDLFPPTHQRQMWLYLSLELAGVISQRLVPVAVGEGRVAAFEIFIPTPHARTLLASGSLEELGDYIREFSGREGICSFEDYLLRLVEADLITPTAAVAYSDKPGDLQIRLRKLDARRHPESVNQVQFRLLE